MVGAAAGSKVHVVVVLVVAVAVAAAAAAEVVTDKRTLRKE